MSQNVNDYMPLFLKGKDNNVSLPSLCLVAIASCCIGFMLYFLRSILIPFAISIFLMYLIQPVVNILTRPPKRWCYKCARRHGESCFESLRSITRSRTFYSEVPEFGPGLGTQEPPNSPNLHSFRRIPSVYSDPDYDVDQMITSDRKCLDLPVIPRWMAVIVAITLSVCFLTLLGTMVYISIMNLQDDFSWYEEGANEVFKFLNKNMAQFGYSFNSDVVPWIFKTVKNYIPRVLTFLIGCVWYSVYVVIFLLFLLINPSKPIPSSIWSTIDLHIRRYIRLKTTICLLVGFLTGLILWLLKVRLSWIFGLVAFFANFIPNLGAIVAVILPSPLILFDPDLSNMCKALAFVLPSTLHIIVGNVIEPKVSFYFWNLN
mmetsp:Transcript_1311/g.1714  ORF Transcript_1311/g.1714 Transcript_1311/m.1714 type:complete len:374 (-) Transcript_1311:41-1162(-)